MNRCVCIYDLDGWERERERAGWCEGINFLGGAVRCGVVWLVGGGGWLVGWYICVYIFMYIRGERERRGYLELDVLS